MRSLEQQNNNISTACRIWSEIEGGRESVLPLLCKVGFGAHGHALTQSISQQKPLPTQHSSVVFMHLLQLKRFVTPRLQLERFDSHALFRDGVQVRFRAEKV